MKAFAKLYAALDETTQTGEKGDSLARHYAAVTAEDADVEIAPRRVPMGGSRRVGNGAGKAGGDAAEGAGE
jgi:hypothetical protein